MNNKTVLPIIFIAALSLFLASSWGVLTRQAWSTNLTYVALAGGIIFIYLFIKEVWQSTNIEKSEKIMWTIGIIFMTTIVAIVYLLSARKRVTRETEAFHSDFLNIKRTKNGIQ